MKHNKKELQELLRIANKAINYSNLSPLCLSHWIKEKNRIENLLNYKD